MRKFDFINANAEIVKKLENMGMVKWKTSFYFGIYSRYLYYRENGINRTKSIEQAASDFYVSRTRGFAAIKEMENDV